jgi:hypothetical protein
LTANEVTSFNDFRTFLKKKSDRLLITVNHG